MQTFSIFFCNFVAEMKKIGVFIIIFLVLGGIFCFEQYYRLMVNNLSNKNGESCLVYVYPKTDMDSLVRNLQENFKFGSIANFRFHAKLLGLTEIKAGCYSVPAHIGDLRLIRMFKFGHQTPVKLTINNIRTREQLAQRISNQLMLDSAEIVSRLCDNDYMAQYGLKRETAVCLFLPDTYEVWWTTTADDLFAKMNQNYNRFWTDERKQKAAKLGLSPQEVATLASIVEEETNKDVDKPIVAGLYMNRLRIGMRLQACPTIKFAWQDFGLRRILKRHLEIDSPYNTYKYAGLPPGPIRIPTAKTMDFVLNPTKSDYLYMCANKAFDGTHHFSSNYAEHSQYAREYQAELNKRNIK